MPAMVAGQFEFVHNVRVSGMLHGRVVRPPAVGATLVSVDEESVKGMPGLIKVVVKKNFVGVVAEKPWQAIQAAGKLKVNWTPGTGLTPQAGFYESLRSQPARDTLMVDSKDVDQQPGAGGNRSEGHLLSSVSDARLGGEFLRCRGCAGGDGDYLVGYAGGLVSAQSTCAMVLGLKAENIRVIFRRGSGCYGVNGADTVTYDAAVLSQAVGKPVRVQLTRKDEMAWENYGNAFVMDERAGLDAQGNIIAWDHEAWSPGLGNRPGPGTPGNIITGMLLGFQPDPFTPRSPAPAPANFNNNSNGIPSYLAGRFGGKVAWHGHDYQ